MNNKSSSKNIDIYLKLQELELILKQFGKKLDEIVTSNKSLRNDINLANQRFVENSIKIKEMEKDIEKLWTYSKNTRNLVNSNSSWISNRTAIEKFILGFVSIIGIANVALIIQIIF